MYLKTKPDPPMYVRHEKPSFRTQYEHDKYWNEEMKRWVEGYSGLTGIHYMYIQEMKLLTIDGSLIRPYWRQCDSEFFNAWDKSKNDKRDLMLIKRTELGFSSMAGAAIPIHTMLTKPGSKCILTSADDERRRVLFDDKLRIAFDNLDDDIRPEKARTRSKGQQDLFLAKEDKVNRSFSGLQSRTIGIDTVKNPTAFEAHRCMYILIDELFLHPKSTIAKSAAARRLVQGTKKIGSMCFGGTVGNMTTVGAQEALKIYKSAEHTGVDICYLGGNRGLAEFMTNGWEDIEAAESWRLQELEKYSKAEDKTDYFKFMTDYPGSIEEVFNLVTDCKLPPEVQLTLNEAKKSIEREGIKNTKYHVVTNGTIIRANPDQLTGKINIIKGPKAGHIYIAGTDPIPFGNNLLGEGSDYSIVIMDYETREFVADYTERNLNSELVVQNSIMLQRLYGGALTMLELNRGEVALKEYISQGATYLLAPMPTHLGIVWEERKYPFGFAMVGGQGNQISARCENLVMKWLYAHASKCRHERLIHELKKLSTPANTDVLSAAKACLLYAAELDEIRKIHQYAPQITRTSQLVVNEKGETVRKIVETPITR